MLSVLQNKLSALVVTLTTFIILIVVAVAVFWSTMTSALDNYLNQQTEVLGNSLATQAAFNATQSILTNDLLSLNVLLNRLVIDENILSARVFNKKDELLAEASSNGSTSVSSRDWRPVENQRVYSSSVKFRDEIVGHVLITLDKTPAQQTLTHLNNLLIGVAIFITALATLVIVLVTKWLYAPIYQITDAIQAMKHGVKDVPLPSNTYLEANELSTAFASLKNLEWNLPKQKESEESVGKPEHSQFEIDFESIIKAKEKETCVLYFEFCNLDSWHNALSPLDVANLLTPIYRALFRASENYQGVVHQYKGNSVLIFFKTMNCEDSIYMNAVCTGQLFIGLMQHLLNGDVYKDTPKLNFHLSLHDCNDELSSLADKDTFEIEKAEQHLVELKAYDSLNIYNTLLLDEKVVTVPDFQHRIVTSLPEIVEINGEEKLLYTLKGISERYQSGIDDTIEMLNEDTDTIS
ncbi:AhpA/YtjB family protein [Marinomonas balearica]|uniref:Putative membrane protein affecting hemolysin expression n=1 Tax=Marinomonas balearica TaxID=491947 RepID=A0A4R6M8C3_9GAMM|nr:AhpA/YtjB family protein [Marinomonas balearica]TDO96419.1 putative membrane protein affecting hemolysin expression [Marinomonas balearica]